MPVNRTSIPARSKTPWLSSGSAITTSRAGSSAISRLGLRRHWAGRHDMFSPATTKDSIKRTPSMAFWNRRKSLDLVASRSSHSALKPTLGWLHLVGLGVGGIVGTGIYTLTGVGAGMAGPAVILSFGVAGIV